MAGRDGSDDGDRARLQRERRRSPSHDLQTLNAAERAPLGKTSLRVTRLGLGTAPLGGLFEAVTDDEAHRVVEAAWQAGIRFFDTAPLYGHGLAERRLGEVLRTKPRNEFVLATKDGVMRSVEESLARFGLDGVDVLHIHDPDEHFEEALGGAYPALERLRAEGSIKAVGAGMNQAEMLARFAREADFDCFLLAGRYTLLDHLGAKELLGLCIEHRIGIIAGGVFNSGILADPRPGANFNYQPAPPELVRRAEELKAICERHGVELKAAAIQFPLRHHAVASVLTGCRSVAEVEENVRMFQTSIPDQLWGALGA
ncbi:MAG: aldo/keto reductase [Chloroflexi bacterium]|nr:MAG: aldo/keto reductase [Chloroflexota bacterium]